MNLPKELIPTDIFKVRLPNGASASLPMCHPIFQKWDGEPPRFDFGKKPILNCEGEPCFAELAILRMLFKNGWNGAWIETYGGTHYLRSMPKEWKLNSEHVSIPKEKEAVLQRIWDTAKTTACFDVLAWNDENTLLFEAKRTGKDKLTGAQIKFIEGALACGISPENMIIVEWSA